MLHDAFICHASEDKAEFVRPLAEQLRSEHVDVWYDEFSLQVGDSLRRSIDKGLSQSRFGIVVLSPHFLGKQWSQWELDGLVARQNSGEGDVILPVWHQVQREEVLAFSPPLADRLAVSSELGLSEVVRRLVSAVHPQGSTLVIARDQLLDWECSPPVVTDDWWLDVAAASESNDLEGGWQEPMGWGRWGFPLPPSSKLPSERGYRLAWAAVQMMWQAEADSHPITQVTPPEEVHEFISSQPGLHEMCTENVRYLITYAPQLVMKGAGGAYEAAIEELYQSSLQSRAARRARRDEHGTALTTDGTAPRCDEEYALRDPNLGGYEAPHVACGFVQGNYVANGPPVMYYCHIDYVAWLLSEKSRWMSEPIRDILTRGMAGWGVWPWYANERRAIEDLGFEDTPFTGKFADAITRARRHETFRPGADARRDVEHRLAFSARLLSLPEDGATLAARLLSPEFLTVYYEDRNKRRMRRAART